MCIYQYLLINSFLILLGFNIVVLSDLPRPRGVSISRAAIYTPKETFLCEDGLKTIKYSQINDDFCDCADGSDEPGTSACSNGVFHCMNLGYVAKNIPSSRVNDGICDCCDASDEYNSNNQCVNNCLELGKEERQRERNRQELIKKGALLRGELIIKGKTLKDERKKKLDELHDRKLESEAIRDEKKTRKEQAEAVENEALEVYREIQEAEKREQTENKMNENRKDAEDTFERFDSNHDGFVEIVEIQTRIAFDKDRNGVVTVEEAKFFLDERERVDRETFITLAWPRIKPYLMLDSGLFKPPVTENEDGVEEPDYDTDTKKENNVNKEEEEDNVEDHNEHQENIDHIHQQEDTDSTSEHEDHADLQNEDDESGEEHVDEDSDSADDSVVDSATKTEPEYDPETQKLIEQANAARNEYLEADRLVREIETDIKDTEELILKDYGPEEEYAALDGECFNYEDREYVYKLCPFDRATQQPRSGGSETRLGSWDRWIGDQDNKYSKMLFSNGASCWNGPQRSATVNIECGLEHKITSVSEPNRCEYHFEFQTSAACKPTDDSSVGDIHDEL